MSEVENMYKNANAYKNLCECSFKNLYDYSIDYGQDVCIHAEDEIRTDCEGCKLAEQNVKYYPPFTAEKQIELIKWLCKNDKFHCLEIEFFIKEKDYKISTYQKASNFNEDFTETLASLINNLWQSLTEEQRQQIKEILE